MSDRDWMRQASCVGKPTIYFFPPRNRRTMRLIQKAKIICSDCPVRVECLSYAVYHDIYYGVWGGMSKDERFKLPSSVRARLRRAWAKRMGGGESHG